MRTNWLWILIVTCAWLGCACGRLAAQPVPPPDAPAPAKEDDETAKPGDAADDAAGPGDLQAPDDTVDPAKDNPLSTRQKQVRDRFTELEKLLLRMAELTAPTDPKRAALLRQAVAQSKQRDIDHQFDELVQLLGSQRLALAVKGQGDVQRDLARLLELLLSEDRSKRIESEKERVREYLKRVNKIIKEQKSVQGDTSRGAEPGPLAERQQELSDKTGELAEDVKRDAADKLPTPQDEPAEQDKPPGTPDKDGQPGGEQQNDADKQDGDKSDKGDKQDGEPKDGDKKDGDKKDGDKKDSDKKDADKKDSEGKDTKKQDGDPKEAQPSESDKDAKPSPGKPSDQPPMPGQPNPGESPPSDQPPPADNPAQKRLEEAQRRMQEAQEKLEQAKKDEATDKQAEALKELEQAKAELEEILRQLREEEMARTLAMLEGRFRKMLAAQVEVYEGTKRVDSVAQAERDRDDEIEAGRLSRQESQIVVEADKCLTVLREEGSAVALPEAVVEMREDMQQVVERLARNEVGELTQAVEADIIAALEEMIAALKKAQKDIEQKQQQQNDQGGAPDGEPPLVDVLAELKMIRALQMRVNTRTQRYAELNRQEQADAPEVLEALRRLAEREQRIHKVTRDIVVGRNR